MTRPVSLIAMCLLAAVTVAVCWLAWVLVALAVTV
jgi:hypothetical protein